MRPLYSYSIYQDTSLGRRLVRTFCSRGRSAHAVAMEYHEQFPNDHRLGKLWFAVRWSDRGKITDGELLEMDTPEVSSGKTN